MKFKSVVGYEGSYIKITVDNASGSYCLGDMFWCGEDDVFDEVILVSDRVSREDVIRWSEGNGLPSSERKRLLGMLTQSGVI